MSVAVLEKNVAAPTGETKLLPGKIGFRKLLTVILQLGLLALVIHQFQIESVVFFRLALLAFAGCIVHAVLPFRFRL